MQTIIFSVYYAILLLATIIGIARYRRLDTAFRFIVILLMLTIISESASYILVEFKEYDTRYALFHIYSMLQLALVSLYFIYAIKPLHYRKLIVVAFILCPLVGILNIIFLQPINKLNTNMLMFESVAINTMALYFIYHSMKRANVQNIFKNPHTKIALLLLIMWSSTFFFWAFISVLFIGQWQYVNIASHFFMMVNIIAYAGIGSILNSYLKNK